MDIHKLTLKFMWRGKRPRIPNMTLKENRVIELTLPNFKTYYKATVSRQCGVGERIYKQISGTELNPEIDPHKYSQLIFEKGKRQYNKKR